MKYIFFILFLFVFEVSESQTRIISADFINGNSFDLDNWKMLSSFDEANGNFVQFEPYNGQVASQQTKVFVAYDNEAISIMAICKSDSTGKIYKILTKRDDFGQADYFGFYLDPYKTGITGYGFFVTAAGVQIDMKLDNNKKDYDWDAVWYSKVMLNDSGYTVIIKVPYSAFRFPKNKTSQSWAINFYRNLQYKREIDTWNYVDINKTGILNQMGIVTGLKNIEPPLHLDLMPHFSSYVQKTSDLKKFPHSFSFGLDMKYSINESFTLDMMLIPDFGQIRSDDQVLNLSPYEIYYNEKRYFFTEGTEIFNKGNIFYSRRIGHTPSKYSEVSEHLLPNEIIVVNPEQTQILNATKVSGKTNKGIGIGFLNAVTNATYAQILDTVRNTTRTYLTQSFANYNVMALNLPFPHSSYLSLTNTDFYSPDNKYNAEVWAQTMVLKNKTNSWQINQLFSQSYIFDDTMKAVVGTAGKFALLKTKGRFRFSFNNFFYDDKYNPNDMGYLAKNNIVTSSLSFAYNIYKPFWKFLNLRNSVSIVQNRQYVNFNKISTQINIYSAAKFLNFTSVGMMQNIKPFVSYDYSESRTTGLFYIRDPEYNVRTWISTNYSNPLAIDLSFTYKTVKRRLTKPWAISYAFAPRIRFSDKFFVTISDSYSKSFNDAGYVAKSDDSVFFGVRNISNRIMTMEFDYNISKDVSTNLRIRHNWTVVNYQDYYLLSKTGFLYPLSFPYHYFENKDINSNFFNIDFIFKWIIVPGSELSVAYKLKITSSTDVMFDNYYDNFDDMWQNNPVIQSLSAKLILYFNSQMLKKRSNKSR